MFAVTGITGNVGGEVARNLLAAGQPVRAVVRETRKGEAWANRDCDLVEADINNAPALTAAFQGADGVFVLVPSNFDPSPDFREARAIASTLRSALAAARPGRVVYLSTIGAQATQSNLLRQHSIIEQALGELSIPITFLRPGWFMENSSWDVAPAMKNGLIPSFLQPLDKAVPMVATADIGRVAAETYPDHVDRPQRSRTGSAASCDSAGDRGHIRRPAGPSRQHGSGATRDLGVAVQIAGHEEPHAPHSNARRLQPRLD